MTDNGRAKLRRALLTFVDETPPAPEWLDWDIQSIRTQHNNRSVPGPLLAVATMVTVLVLIGGFAAMARFAPIFGPDAPTTWPESVGGWFDTVVEQGTSISGDPNVVQAELGPIPEFDTTPLGVQQPLVPLTDAADIAMPPWKYLIDFEDPAMSFTETFVVAGSVGDVAVGARSGTFSKDRDGAGFDGAGLCLMGAMPALETPEQSWTISASCAPVSHPYESGVGGTDGLWLGTGDWGEPDDGSTFVGTITVHVTPDTSVVVFKSGDTKLWQRPRGGIALFVGEFTPMDATYTAYNSSGEIIAQDTIFS